MPADDYTAAVSGGLKLKGVNSSSKVSKAHRKKRPNSSQPESAANANAEKSKDGVVDDGEDVKGEQDEATRDDGEASSQLRAGKTEAELKHEERRRKRVCYFHILLLPS